MSNAHLGDVRRSLDNGQYYIYEFAGEEELHWAPLEPFIMGYAFGLPRPDPNGLGACHTETDKRAIIDAIRRLHAAEIAAHRAEMRQISDEDLEWHGTAAEFAAVMAASRAESAVREAALAAGNIARWIALMH